MFFFFNDTATTEIYTLSLHDALPISPSRENQATNRPLDSSEVHTLSRVVLPKPAGAETRMSLRFIPSSIRSPRRGRGDRKSTRLNSSHANISYAVFCLKKKKNTIINL